MGAISPEQWQEINPYLDHVLSLPQEDRSAWLQSFTAERPDLAGVMQKLLEHHLAAAQENFLEQQPSLPVNESTAGQIMGPYTLISLLGHGGMGTVWLAQRSDGRFERRVAIKFLRSPVATQGGSERFKREGKILGQLSHPNIAELIDAGVSASAEPYLVLEHVEGRHLDKYCDERHLDLQSRIRLFLQVLSAVAHAHASLIVHRDIKPSNVLVRNDGQVKLLDFGIAKLLSDESTGEATLLTLEAGSALTPQFAAPEQITGGPITTATDVYALGLLLYILLTGQHPAGGSTRSAAELVKAITEIEPLHLSDAVASCSEPDNVAQNRSTTADKLRRHLRGDLDTIVAKALKKNPQERYPSVLALTDDLQRYLKHEPISARPDSFTYRTGKFVARHKLGVTFAALAVIAAATALIAMQRQARRAEYRFQQVRKLAHTVLFDLNPQIENLAGSTPARELLVKTSLEYLDSLAAESGNDPKLQIELATAYEKIGDVQGNSRWYSNLGHPEASLESYRKAVAIAGKLRPSAEALEILAGAYARIGTVQATQLGDRITGRETLRTATQIADSIPATTARQDYQLRVEAYGYLGDIDEINDPSRAAEPIQRALAIAREWSRAEPSPQPKVYVAVLMKDWADIQWGMGDLNTARSILLDSLKIFQDLMVQEPNNAEWRTQEIVDWERMGLLSGHPDFFNLGDRKTAAEWFQKLVLQGQRNLDEDPKDIRARFDLSEAIAELAAVYRDSDPHRSEELYRRSIALSTSALAADPQDFEILYWQSFERIGFASLALRVGKNSIARDQVQKAISVLEGLSSRDPVEISAHQLLALALQERAASQLRGGNMKGAEPDLRRSEDILTKLSNENPSNLTILRDLADCHRAKGDLASRRSQWKNAQDEYQKSLGLWQRWLQIGKSSAYDQRQRALATSLVSNAAGRIARAQ